jgi:hypothetical protein
MGGGEANGMLGKIAVVGCIEIWLSVGGRGGDLKFEISDGGRLGGGGDG